MPSPINRFIQDYFWIPISQTKNKASFLISGNQKTTKNLKLKKWQWTLQFLTSDIQILHLFECW